MPESTSPFDHISEFGQSTGLTPLERLPMSTFKQNAVFDATAVKAASMLTPSDYEIIAAGVGNQHGAGSMGQVEQDLRTLNHIELINKYGSDLASKMRDQLTTATNNRLARSLGYRSTSDTSLDVAKGVGTGFAGSVADIGGFGVSLINDQAGAAMAKQTQKYRDEVNASLSSSAQGAKKNLEQINALDSRDSQAEYDAAIANGDSTTSAGAGRLWDSFSNSFVNAASDPTTLLQGTSEGVGSLLLAGPLAGGVKAGTAAVIGKEAVLAAKAAGEISKAAGVAAPAGARAVNLAQASALPVSIGTIEASSTFGGTANEILNTPYESLEQTSPEFKAKVEEYQQSGLLPEEAKMKARYELASETGQTAAAWQFPAAVVAGSITRFAEAPFKVNSVGNALSNALVKEPTEEAIQGATGQLAQNKAIQDNVNPEQDLLANVGEQAGTGAVYGAGTGAAVQAPGAVVKGVTAVASGVLAGTRKGLTALSDVVEDRAAKRDAQNFESQNEEATQIVANAPATTELANTSIDSAEATPEAKDKAKSVVQTTFDALKIDPQQLGVDSLNEDLTQAVTSASNVTEAIGNVASIMSQMGAARENVPQEQQADVDSYQTEAAILLTKLIGQLDSALSQDKTSLDILPTGSPVLEQYNNTVGFLETVRQHPTIKRELDKAQTLLNKTLDGVTDEQLNSPKAQQIVNAAVASATISPAEGNLETINKILNHRDDEGGPYIFSEGQQQILRVSQALLQARKDLAAMNAQAGSNTRLDVVDGEIFNRDKYLNERAPKMSAQEFGMNILSLVKNKDFAGATAKLKEFSQFVEHMNNKVGAYKKHYADFGSKGVMNAEPIHYKALLPRFTEEGGVEFANTSTIRGHRGIYVAPNNATSVGLAQTVADETQILANVFNNFVETFPELGVGKVDAVPLTSELQGKVADVVAKHKQIKPEPKKTTEQVVVPASKPEPVKENISVEQAVASARKRFARMRKTDLLGVITDNAFKATEKNLLEAGMPKAAAAFMAEYERLLDEKTQQDLAVKSAEEFIQPEVNETPSEVKATEPVVIETPTTPVVSTPTPKKEEPKPEPVVETKPVGFLEKVGKPIVDRIFRMFNARLDKQGNNISRLFAGDSTTSSVQFVLDAIATPESVAKLLGRKPKFSTSPEILADYQHLLNKFVPKFAQLVNGNLKAFLAKEGITTAQEIADWSNRSENKTFNIVEDVDGTFQYNQDMLEAAVMAALQWVIESSGRQTPMDEETVKKLTGKEVDEVSYEHMNKLKEGFSEEQIKFGIASKIAQYWGLKGKSDTRLGYADAIPEALAGEIIQALMKGGFVKPLEETAVIFYNEETGKEISRVNRYVPTEVLGKLVEYPSLIEEMVLTEPEELVFLGGDLPPVAKTKINSGGVNNSDTQMSAMEAQQKNPFFENVSGVSALLSMGVDGALSLFAHGELTAETKGNRNNLESMKGKNASISNAYAEMKNMLAKTKSRAEAMGTTSDKVEVRYAINVTKNGRYQMLGRYTPQASKLMRIAFMTTWSTLNLLENRAHARNFNIAIAQAFGQKVHRESFAKIEEGVAASLGKLDAVAKEALLSWLNDQSTKFPTETIKQAFTETGIEITPAAFNAYVEYMRTKMLGVDMKAFKTSLSLEADGITNGPLNALMLLNIGKITPEFVMNLRRGGIFLGQDLTTYDSFSGQDIYLNSAEAMQESIKDLSTALDKFPKAQAQQRALLDVMRILLPEYVVSKYNEKNELQLEFSRKLIKNPLTVILYGSSPNGIAGKIAGELLDAFYEKATKAAQDGVNPAEAFFPGYENPQRNYELLIKLINELTTKNLNHWVDKNEDTKYGVADNERKVPDRMAKPIDFSTITFTTAEYESIRANILVGMVEPMVEGIHNSLGSDIFTAMEQIKNATQFQSSVYAAMFNARVKEAIKSRQKDEDGNPVSSWMSPKELEAIAKELRPFFPMLRTEDHTIVMMKEKPLSSNDISYSRTLDGKMRTAPKVFFPASVGVGGIPYTVIAYADAAMIQRAANAGVLESTLPVHDGVEMPLDKVGEISSGLNKAVYDSTMQNPMKDIQKMFDKFLDNEGMIHNFLVEQIQSASNYFEKINPKTKARYGQEGTKEAYPEIYSIMATAGLFPFSDKENDASDMSATELADAAISEMKNTNYQLQESAEVIDLRHQAISEVAASYDHMASAHIGYHNGKPTLGTTDVDAIAEHLQNRVDELKAKKSADFKAQQEKNAAIGKLHSTTGVHILRGNNFLTLAKALNASKRQMQLLKHLTAILKNKDVSVITGSEEQINAYRESIGQPKYNEEDLNGLHGQTQFTETGAVIYLLNPSSETVLHELVHAATFQVISDYFNPDKEVSENAIDAIQNLQKLMSKFMSMPMGRDTLANQKIGQVRNVIKGYEAKGEHAEALNEFMAWSLANEGIYKDLESRKTDQGFFKTLAKNIIKAIENILGTTFKDTFASQLLFNSAVLFKQITTPDVNVALNHQSATTDPRLTQIRSMLDMNVLSKLRERMAKVRAGDRTINLNVDAEEANKSVELADRIAQTFNLNEEQRVTMITLVMATSSLGSLDPSVMTRIQELYDHALKNLSESDLADATTTDRVLREQQGIPRYALLTDLNSSKDAKGRSRLLPTFLALSVVDNNFRNALYNIAVPTNPKVPGKTLDAMLENIGNGAMDSLNKYLSMENQPGNVQVAMDQLLENIQALSYREQTRVDKASIKLNNFLTDMEDKLVVKKDELADKVNAVANTQLTSTNPIRKAAGIGLSVVSSLASSKVADEKARAIIENLNKFAGQGGLAKAIADSGIQKLITDMVGRTGDNFPIYDWIKPARTMVQQVRQQSRDDLPIIFAKKFSRELTQQEWAMMYKVIGRTDLAALLNNKNVTDVLNLIVSKTARDDKIAELEEVLYTYPNSTNMNQVLVEAKQLAHFMNTGIPGNDLKANAQTIAHLTALVRNEPFTTALDQLITLYALRELPQEHKDIVAELINTEGDGVKFITDYLYQTRLDEMSKVGVASRYNYRKGHLPSDQKVDGDVIVAPISKENELALLGYKRIGDYNSPTNDPDNERKAYFHSPVAQKAPVSQGIIQNVRHTVFGVDSYHGYSTTKMAGRITNPKLVARLKKQIFQNDNKVESFIPIRNEDGDIIAFDRNFDPEMLLPLQQSEHFGKMVAVWRGRQIEEAISKDVNTGVIGGMKQMWFKDKGTARAKEYINLKDPRGLTPVQRDMVKLFTPLFIEQLDDVFGDEGWFVRMDLVDDVIGYRNASVGDFFTGNSNWSPETQKVVRNMMVLLGDERAYRLLMGGEKRLQALMVDARQTIVVKSVVIPMYNIMSNTLHLVSRGVPLHMIAKGSLRKVAEIQQYAKSQVRLVELEAEIRAEKNELKRKQFEVERQAIKDSHTRMSIWPLIQAGEFSTIADVGMTADDLDVTSGKLTEWVENQISKMPPALQTAARYGYISRDTALFRGLQKSVQYGDFVAKAILYDHLVENKKIDPKVVLAQITEEFVNYDRLPGRVRGSLENMGLLWFYNYKIRSVKVGLSVLRNNPLHAALAMALPLPDSAGLPIEENLFAVAAEGNLSYSIGPSMALHAINLNPWVNSMN